MFCLFKSVVRTAYLGFLLFWSIYLWGYSKKYFTLFLVGLLCVTCLYAGMTKTIFFQTKGNSYNLNDASSGRLSLWKNDLNLFSGLSIEKKILGLGIVPGKAKIKNKSNAVFGHHNDYLELLVKGGILSILMYLSILSILFIQIITSDTNKQIKYLFLALLVSVTIMNFVSNSYLARVELGQLFWLFMGIFYYIKQLAETKELNYA